MRIKLLLRRLKNLGAGLRKTVSKHLKLQRKIAQDYTPAFKRFMYSQRLVAVANYSEEGCYQSVLFWFSSGL